MPAIQILVIGHPGTGKSTAWEKMNPAETIIITPNAKTLPWEGSANDYVKGKNRIVTSDLLTVPAILKKINDEKPEVKYVLIEDITHFFNARTMSPAFTQRKLGNDAYAKWGELANDIAAIVLGAENFRDDLTIVYNGHAEGTEDGSVSIQTPGKLLDRDFKVLSYFTYVFHSLVSMEDQKVVYKFLTNRDGTHEAKTPRGCFKDLHIDNDMAVIIPRIKEYINKSSK